eukprot:2445996-Pyramimonas_sp.AAC.1
MACRPDSKASGWTPSSTKPCRPHRRLHLHVPLRGNLPLRTRRLSRWPRAHWGSSSGCIGRCERPWRAAGRNRSSERQLDTAMGVCSSIQTGMEAYR